VALLAVVAVAVLVGFFYLERTCAASTPGTAYKRQQQARGERLDPAALVPPPVPDEQELCLDPLLAPPFDYLPGTQQPRDTNA